jgi:hypothetical protein
MCGIVGFTGRQQAAPVLLDGLSKLEYRGYDSAGLAVRDGTSLADRLDTVEGEVDTLQDQMGNYPTGENDPDVATRFTNVESAATTLAGRVTTAEGDIDALETRAGDLETELASHDFKYAGSQTENGAADNVVETVTTANEDREVLLASHDKDAVEYASGVKVNPSIGQLAINSIKLGAATLTFDTNSESLVVNF